MPRRAVQHRSVPATAKPRPVSVLVVDDHRTFGDALALAMRMEKGFIVRVATNGRDAVVAAADEEPDVVLMDMEMPGMSGVDTIRRVLEARPEARVVVLSAHDDELTQARAIDAGAIGYLRKDTPLEDIPALIRRAAAGETLMDPEEGLRLLRRLRHQRHQEATERQRVNRLTPRQIEILQLLADGTPQQDILDTLKVSPYTLRTHVQNILTRLGVHTKLEAVALAMRHGKIRSRS